jgi:hypothetical protein
MRRSRFRKNTSSKGLITMAEVEILKATLDEGLRRIKGSI